MFLRAFHLRGAREAKPDYPLGENINVVPRTLATKTQRNDVNYRSVLPNGVNQSVPLTDRSKTPKPHEVFPKRLTLLFGIGLQSFGYIKQLLPYPPIRNLGE